MRPHNITVCVSLSLHKDGATYVWRPVRLEEACVNQVDVDNNYSSRRNTASDMRTNYLADYSHFRLWYSRAISRLGRNRASHTSRTQCNLQRRSPVLPRDLITFEDMESGTRDPKERDRPVLIFGGKMSGYFAFNGVWSGPRNWVPG